MGDLYLMVLTLLISNFVFTVSTTTDLVIVTTDPPNENDTIKEGNKSSIALPELKSMHVECNVSNRYAHTVVSSRYKNPANIAQEVTFFINLPDTAFISGFIMEIKGRTYEAFVKEKEEAKREYQQAVQSGIGAAHVEQARDSNKFTVAVNVEPRSKVTFNLSYEELLIRKHGKYKMVINLQPGQLVKDLKVNVLINETKPIIDVIAPALKSGNEIFEENKNKENEYAKITQIGDNNKCVQIYFAPTVQQQKEMAKSLEALAANIWENRDPYYNDYLYNNEEKKKKKATGEDGISGQFVFEYDVDRDTKGGDVLVNDGYFVHFFAPTDLKPLPKHVIFVLDVSGSMGGRKIEQLKQAMLVILDELNPNDYFNLIEFSFGAKAWNLDNTSASPSFQTSRNIWWSPPEEVNPGVLQELPPAYPATAKYKQKAKKIVEDMEAGGGTNIYDALNVSLNLTLQGIPEDKNGKNNRQPIIIFLTDGDATDGETDPTKILNTVDELNVEGEKAAIFSLALGYDANKEFLKKLSLRNLGFMRQIYEASDAALQLQDFYKQISSPLLANVTFKYPQDQVDSVTKHNFNALFDGSEFVVAGKMENPKDKILYVHGLTYDGPIDFQPVIISIPESEQFKYQIGPLERLWAYMTIKQLLDKNDEIFAIDSNTTEAKEFKNNALKLALKYSFVTPITSLVVVKPNETENVNAEDFKQFGDFGYSGYSTPVAFSALSASGGYGGFGGGYAAGPVSTFSNYAGQSFVTGVPHIDSLLAPELSADRDTAYFSHGFVGGPFSFDTDIPELPWLSLLRLNEFEITINGTNYVVGNNLTHVDVNPCKVAALEGVCTLLSQCPKIYSLLDTFETFFDRYFCTLKPNFIGVCCINLEND